jgi:hypothetical protein
MLHPGYQQFGAFFATWVPISNMAAERETWRRNVLERTSSVLQEAARKIENELNSVMK